MSGEEVVPDPPHPADPDVLRLAVPALGALAIEPVFLMTDSAIIGHLGTAQLAGLGAGSAILLNLVNLCLFLAFATTASVSRRVGHGDLAGGAASSVDGLWLATAIGVGLAGVLAAAMPGLIAVIDPGPAASNYAATYLWISLGGVPAMLIVLAATGVLRGFGDAWTPLAVSIGSGGVNIALNIALVYGVDLGITGSALGTVITQNLTAAVLLVLVGRRLRPHGVSLQPRARGLRALGANSFALFVRTLSLRVALFAMTFVAARQGEVALASHQSCLTISGLFEIPGGALGIAAQMSVSRSLGAGRVELARLIVARLIRWGLGLGLVLAALLAFARPAFAPLFTSDPAVRAQLVAVLLVLAAVQPIGGVLWVLDGVFIGAGDGRYLAWAGVATTVAFLPILAFVEIAYGTLLALWLGLGGYLALRLAALLLRLRADAWVVVGAHA